jgi:hypothetical protein
MWQKDVDIPDSRLYQFLESVMPDESDNLDEPAYSFIDPDWEMDDERERWRE